MKIGVLSDTHSVLPPEVFEYFKSCDAIWHAGDIGDLSVATKLEAFKPCKIVHGNIDAREVRQHYPAEQRFRCEGLEVYMTHIAGRPPHYNSHIQLLLQRSRPDILVCGHTHILQIHRDPGGMLYINPGAAGNYGIHPVATLIRFEIKDSKPCNMEVIELGPKRY